MKSVIGVVSDTHGLLRPEIRDRLKDCRVILHAGDIGGEEVLRELRKMADVVAVRGNVDRGPWAVRLKKTEHFCCRGKNILVVHDIETLDLEPKAAGIDIVIYGHSHRPSVEYKDGILYLNPGSAGPRRFHLPVSMARLTVEGTRFSPEIVELCAPGHSGEGGVKFS